MKYLTICFRLVLTACWMTGIALTGCVAFDPVVQSRVDDLNQRPYLAILPFGFDIEITKLSTVQTVDGTLSPEETDELAKELELKPGVLPNAEQLTEFRRRLGADLVVAGSILDYGKIRWQWSAAGMLTDMTAESIALGVATAWNPIAIGANIGF